MANNENLKKGKDTHFATNTSEEQAKIAKAGGIASGKVKRKNKSYQEIFDLLQNSPLKKDKTIKVYKEIEGECTYVDTNLIDYLKEKYPNLSEEEINNATFASIKMIELIDHPDAKVAIKAFEVVRDTSGQKPVDKQDTNFTQEVKYIEVDKSKTDEYKRLINEVVNEGKIKD